MQLNDWLPSNSTKVIAQSILLILLLFSVISTVIIYFPKILWAIPITSVAVLLWAVLSPTRKERDL